MNKKLRGDNVMYRRHSRPIVKKKSLLKKIIRAIRIGKGVLPLTPIEKSIIEGINLGTSVLENTKQRYKIIYVSAYIRRNGTPIGEHKRRLHEEYYLDINALIYDLGKDGIINYLREILRKLN